MGPMAPWGVPQVLQLPVTGLPSYFCFQKLDNLTRDSKKIITLFKSVQYSRSDDDLIRTSTQALDGLAPKCELINMHELFKKSTNNYVTLLPLENGINLNTKG